MAGAIEVCARKGIENVDSDRWASCVRHVITKVENHYRETDGLVERAVEELVISLGHEDSDSEDGLAEDEDLSE